MDTICQECGCGKSEYARGFCKAHYSKHRHDGSLPKLPPKQKSVCKKQGCTEVHSAKGFCQQHYREYKVGNNPSVYRNIEIKRKERTRRFKQEMVNLKGGKCEICGYNKNIMCLDFHHEDPSRKEGEPNKILRKKEISTIKKEIEKCRLLCKNCHNDIHRPDGRAKRYEPYPELMVGWFAEGAARAGSEPEILEAP